MISKWKTRGLTAGVALALAAAYPAVAQDDEATFSISGWINEGAAFYDDGESSDIVQTSDNGTTLGSRITFAGSAPLPNSGMKAGFEVILEPQSIFTPLIFSNQTNFDSQVGGDIRLLGSSAYVEGKAGKLTFGLQSMPTDNIAVLADPSLTLWSSISPLFRFNGFSIRGTGDGAAVWGDFAECLTGNELQGAGGIGIDCNGIYRNGIRYDLPTITEGLNIAIGYANDDIYDVALKYNHDFGGATGVFHIGYAENNGGTTFYESASNLQVQAGLMHKDSGIFGTLAFQSEEAEDLSATAQAIGYGDDTTAWWFKGGVKRSFFSWGDTALTGWYGQYNDQFGDINATLTTGMITDSQMDRFGLSIDQYFGSKLIMYLVWETLDIEVDGTTTQVEAAFNNAEQINSVVLGMTFFF
ncbi:MAG: porin [Pseudomonadota bacterium]